MRLAIAWAIVVACAAVVLGWRLTQGFAIETGLLAMLPPGQSDSIAAAAEARISQTVARRLLIATSHPDRQVARDAADRLTRSLTEAELATVVPAGLASEETSHLLHALARHAPGLLSRRDRDDLEAGRGEVVARRALSRSLLPLQPAGDTDMAADPLLLSAAFLADLPRPPSRLTPQDGRLEGEDQGQTTVLRIFAVNGNPFDTTAQAPLASKLAAERAALQQELPALRILATGAALYAMAGSSAAIADVSWIGAIDTAAVLLLLALAFRGIGALGLIALPVAVGMLVGAAAVVLVFRSVHGLALVFATTLIGTAVDYAIHYVSARYAAAKPRERLRLVRMGTLLGLITTVVGYLTILPSPFRALAELALFSATGLTAAWITMAVWLPRLDRSPRLAMPAMLTEAFAWLAARRRLLGAAGAVALVVLTALGASRLSVVDDIRRFQSLPQELRSEEAEIRRLSGLTLAPVILTVAAGDEEKALQREEALLERLQGAGLGAESVASYVPSAARQAENIELVRSRLPGGLLGPLGTALTRSLARPPAPMRPADLPPPLAARLAELKAPVGDGVLHLVQLHEAGRHELVTAAIAGLEGVAVLDIPGRISAAFAAQRGRTIALLSGMIALAFAIAAFRYGWWRGLRTILAPAIAVAVTPPLLALIGEPFSFFNAVGLLLVVSLGVDYAFCLSEADDDHRPFAALAILLSMLTTAITFGLLTLSRTEALGGFGATVAVGTLLCVLLAPLSVTRSR